MNKKNITFLLVLMLIMFSAVSFSSVSADDDDDDEDERSSIESREQEDDDDDEEKVSAVIMEEKKEKNDGGDDVETITQTVVVSPARIVVEDQLITIAVPDRDRDGIVDGEDANPDIAEIYIVKDENLNGIVDTFEYANQ